MARAIRVIVVNCDEDYTADLRVHLLKIDGVKIIAEVDEPALFPSALQQFPAELVVVNLDSDPETLIPLTEKVHQDYPDLCLFAISESNNPNLILNSMRAGFREFLLRPVDDAQLGDAIERLVKTAVSHGPTGELICLFGPNGGSGASTVATNFACELTQLTERGVVLVDLDFAFGHAAMMLDLTVQFSIADLCQTLESIDPAMVQKALIEHDCGVKVLARPQHFVQSEQISAANTANTLNMLCEMFDYVVCDGPMRYDGTNASILDLADVAIMVANLVVPSIRNADRILQELKNQGYNLERLKLVINRDNSETNMLSIDDVEQCLSRPIDFVIPDDPKAIATAINMGQPLLSCAPKSKSRDAIKRMAEAIKNPDGNGKVKEQSLGQSLLSKVFSK